jgi:hypothetical protein
MSPLGQPPHRMMDVAGLTPGEHLTVRMIGA